jgi:hypothetical protein
MWEYPFSDGIDCYILNGDTFKDTSGGSFSLRQEIVVLFNPVYNPKGQ